MLGREARDPVECEAAVGGERVADAEESGIEEPDDVARVRLFDDLALLRLQQRRAREPHGLAGAQDLEMHALALGNVHGHGLVQHRFARQTGDPGIRGIDHDRVALLVRYGDRLVGRFDDGLEQRSRGPQVRYPLRKFLDLGNVSEHRGCADDPARVVLERNAAGNDRGSAYVLMLVEFGLAA